MTAEEFLENELKDLVIKPDGVKISDVMEKYASHVLQEYKKELAEWVDVRIDKYEQETKVYRDLSTYTKNGKLAAFRNVRFHLTKLKEE